MRYQVIPLIGFLAVFLAFGIALIADARLRVYRGHRR